ncbi:MAG: TatD family hydrolase [Prolixibacteraceae bacterium]|nr:TatD family hydrolase [Prolixibacteraceae bacterium]
MYCIDIHTHNIPVGTNRLFILNRFPDSNFVELPPGGFYSVGLHPWYIGAGNACYRQLDSVMRTLKREDVIAVGECGLDKTAKTDLQLQTDIFMQQAEMAEAFQKPVIIHCVRASNEIFQLHKKMNPSIPWILHGFQGNAKTAEQLAGAGFYFSFGSALLDEESKSGEAISVVPPDKLFLETDESAMSIHAVYERTSEILKLSAADLTEKIEWNFRQAFVRQ